MVTVEEVIKDNEVVMDYTGSILGVVVSVNVGSQGNSIVKTQWTANTSSLHEWQLPNTALMSRYAYSGSHMRFKVISRKVNWVKA